MAVGIVGGSGVSIRRWDADFFRKVELAWFFEEILVYLSGWGGSFWLGFVFRDSFAGGLWEVGDFRFVFFLCKLEMLGLF